MAKIQLKLNTKQGVGNLNIRLYQGTINCYAKSNIFIENSIWSNVTNSLKQRVDNKKRKKVTKKIEKLSKYILKKFYNDYAKGELINSKWLKNTVDQFYERPTGLNDYRYYLVPFVEKFINESQNRVNPLTNKIISANTIKAYKTTMSKIVEFQKSVNKTLKIKDVNMEFHKHFTSYLSIEKKYNGTVIEKYIRHIKQFAREAKASGCEISSEIESKNFTYQRSKPIDTYLNIDEISKVFHLEIEEESDLIDSRDLFIIGLWTGLRLGDLVRFSEFKIIKDRIVISETDKTGDNVAIPIHPQVKEILKRRNGKEVPKISVVKFNKDVKEICRLAGINELIVGNKRLPGINRKVKDYYPKYELITSHTCRRSFVSNHYGRIDNKTIMAITTHKSHNQFEKYIKTTFDESASKMEEYWNQKR